MSFCRRTSIAGRSRRGSSLADAFADCPATEAARLAGALKTLAPELGTREVALEASFWPQALAHFRNYQAYEAWRSHGAWIEQRRPRFGPGIAERFAYAATVTEEQRQAAQAFREEARAKIDALLAEDGVFVLPTAPFFAPRLDESAETLDAQRYQMFRLFLLASFFGLPQVSLPLPSDPPLGLSLIGRRGTDRALLALARRLAHDRLPSTTQAMRNFLPASRTTRHSRAARGTSIPSSTRRKSRSAAIVAGSREKPEPSALR